MKDKISLKEALPKIQKEVKEKLKKVQKVHKDFHANISKFGKTIDKAFNLEQEKAYKDLPIPQDTLDYVIAEHLYREGLLSVGKTFERESHINVSEQYKQLFHELHHILEQLQKHKNLKPALLFVVLNVKIISNIYMMNQLDGAKKIARYCRVVEVLLSFKFTNCNTFNF